MSRLGEPFFVQVEQRMRLSMRARERPGLNVSSARFKEAAMPMSILKRLQRDYAAQHDCVSVTDEAATLRRSRALHVVAGGSSRTRVASSSCVTARTRYVDGKKFSSPYSTRTSASRLTGIISRTLSKIFKNLA